MQQAKETKTVSGGSSANEEVRILGRGDYFGDGALDGWVTQQAVVPITFW